ncbi:MAG: phenylalanine--tRNA ligase subunit beta, partial [Candidatus Aenigmarchaeota archaeon]|nr:phenylalanine--tRNA ligase subunit beta [Candidatus Aenigmarchaeota archaeon]
MPTVTFDKKTVLKYLGKKVPDTVLKDRISMLGTDLERVDDTEIVVEIFPNRPDMLSEEGFARALSSFMGIKTGLIKYDVKKSGSFTKVEKTLKIWPYVVTGIVRGLKFDDEKIRALIQLQEKLGVTMCRKRRKGGIGIYPLDKIKLPITFTTMDADKIKFRPLEYPNEITGREILEKHPTGREYGHIIEKQKEFPVFIDASGKIMSMPPAINSHDIGKITEATSDIFLEATGPDLVTLMQAINIISSALADAGGKVYSMDVIYKGKTITTPNLAPSKMKIDIKYINKLLGMEFSEKELNALLAKMGFGREKNSVLVPAYRTDILHPIDIVEDIAIAYGYENFAEEIPNVSTIGTESKSAIFQRKVAEVMVGFSFLECMSYHLSNKEVLVSKMNSSNTKVVHVSNAVNAEYGVLRQGILPGLMK